MLKTVFQLKLIIAFLSMALSLGVNAAVQNYFEASVPVKSQSLVERKSAARIALKEVLVRMSGSDTVLENEQIRAAISKAQGYVEQYQYHKNSDAREINAGKKQVISLVFTPSVVETILRDAGQPFWPENRPKTLVWLVEDHPEFGRQFVNDTNAPEVMESFRLAAAKRGLPLVNPLYDLEDRMVVSEDQLWQLDEFAILEASHRYMADAVLVGRYSVTSSGEYLATWQFFHRKETRVYDSRTADPGLLGDFSLNPLANFFASQYSVIPEAVETPTLVVQVAGVNDFGDFRKAIEYFESLAIISDVAISAVRGDTILVYLQSDSALERFESTLSLDNKITSVISDTQLDVPAWQQIPRGTPNNPLQFRWSG